MFAHKPQYTRITTTGLKVTFVPRPGLLGVEMKDGKPIAVKYPDRIWDSEKGYRLFPDIKGINKQDYDRIKPDLVLYELGDGSLLQADPDVFDGSKMSSHNAASDYQPCYLHLVGKLKLSEMLEFREDEEVPVIQF